MSRKIFPQTLGANTRYALVNILLITNAFVWYYFALDFLQNILKVVVIDPSTTLLIWCLHFGGIAVSAIAGAIFIGRVKDRNRFLVFWLILGILSSVISIMIDITFIPNVLILSLLLGVSLGLGMPCCMGYYTESTGIENRGRVGGTILLFSGLGMVALGATTSGDIGLQRFMLLGWRLFGLVFFLLLTRMRGSIVKNKQSSYKSLLSQRSFILYFIPWIMFSLITYLTTPIQSAIVGKSTVEILIVAENVLIAVFAVVGGFLSDIMGRKRMAIAGFAMLGLGYSVLGIYPEQLFSWYFYTVVDGVAWGILFVIFVVNIWGDLSHSAASDKYYAIGVLPFFISKFLQLTIGNDIVAVIPSPSSIFSFTAFFLFLAVLPLFYAPETLPEKTMKDRDLRSYAEKALEQAQKEAGKSQKKSSAKAEKESEKGKEEAEETPEDEEARKLAEKYY